MHGISRRQFLKSGSLSAAALATAPVWSGWPAALARTTKEMVFRPYLHPWMQEIEFFYATDQNHDPFKSAIQVNKDGVFIPESFGDRKFAVNVQWFVDGFGLVNLAADNGGEFYTLTDFNANAHLNLNYELLRSRIIRNRDVKKRYEKSGTKFSAEVRHLWELSEELFESASKSRNDGERCANLSDKALKYALWAGEKIELEKARQDIEMRKRLDEVFFGCETRQYIWAKSEEFTKRFPELFNFATVTHYVWDTWYEVFEPREGEYNWGVKDNIVNWLLENNITIQGRPLFWFHRVVTPEWLKKKNFDELKKYVEKHTHDLLTHYGDKILQWSVVNEYHDWANVHNHTPEQITEITRLACEKTKSVNPNVTRIINNCCPWAEYAALGKVNRTEIATRPLRSPRKFVEDLLDAGVDFEVLGVQIYFPRRDLSDIVRLLERFEKFGKPIYITEIGATSGPTTETVLNGQRGIPQGPYEWRRHWDEQLQADWAEQVYTLYYSRPSIKAINWYDFADFRPFIVNGGLVREDCSPKRSFNRLKELLRSWGRLPGA